MPFYPIHYFCYWIELKWNFLSHSFFLFVYYFGMGVKRGQVFITLHSILFFKAYAMLLKLSSWVMIPKKKNKHVKTLSHKNVWWFIASFSLLESICFSAMDNLKRKIFNKHKKGDSLDFFWVYFINSQCLMLIWLRDGMLASALCLSFPTICRLLKNKSRSCDFLWIYWNHFFCK